jgi:hypothetical protein
MWCGGLAVVTAAACGSGGTSRSTLPTSTSSTSTTSVASTPTAPSTTAPASSTTQATTATTVTPAPALACATSSAAAAQSAGPYTLTASAGGFTATLTGTVRTNGPTSSELDNPRLSVARTGGQALNSVSLTSTDPKASNQGATLWSLTYPRPTLQPLCLAHFGGQAGEVALVGFYSGGAHCCVIIAAVPIGSGGAGRTVFEDTGDAGGGLQDYQGRALLVAADDAFAYEFASYAGSGLPLRVLDFQGGDFVDVTTSYHQLVAADDSKYWQAWQANQSDGLGLLAAWVADECNLGTGAHAFATLATLNQQGKLGTSEPDQAAGSAYISKLRSFLAQHNYHC